MDNKGNPKSVIVSHVINILEQADAHTRKWKPKSVTVSDKINILEQVDAHIEWASWLRLSMSTLQPTAKNREETERSFIQCKTFSKLRKPLKCLLPQELVSALST
jgi:hypothetical protein